jgi:hypothetical protein
VITEHVDPGQAGHLGIFDPAVENSREVVSDYAAGVRSARAIGARGTRGTRRDRRDRRVRHAA